MSEKFTAREWATMQGGHTVEKTSKYSFIREEITEARYIRTGRDALGRDMNDVAESYFEQLLMLQQILFFRELGFNLNDIQKLLSQDDFDKVRALQSHKQVLTEEINSMHSQ